MYQLFMWGTMIYCEEWEIIDDEIVFPTTICFAIYKKDGPTLQNMNYLMKKLCRRSFQMLDTTIKKL